MITVGLTGASGSGKGYVSSLLLSRGIPALDSDTLVHALYKDDEDLISELAELFGEEILAPQGGVDRRVLRGIVFGSDAKLAKLNKTVHKRVSEYISVWLENCKSEGHKFAFIDAPMLFEAGLDKSLDFTVAVVADKAVRAARIKSRDGLSDADIALRFSHQMDDEHYAVRSNYKIINDGGSPLDAQLDAVLESMSAAWNERHGHKIIPALSHLIHREGHDKKN